MTPQEKRTQLFADCNILWFCFGFLGVLLLIGFAPLLFSDVRTCQTIQILGISILSVVICVAYFLNRKFFLEQDTPQK